MTAYDPKATLANIKTLKSAVALLGLILLLGVGSVLVGSLAPSDRAHAVRSNWAFPADTLDGIEPGEVRIGKTDRGPVFIVRPNEEIWSDLEIVRERANNPLFNTYDDERDLFIVWGVYGFSRTKCALRHAPKHDRPNEPSWPGGYFDPCNGRHFDYAGRILDIPNSWIEPNLQRPFFEIQPQGWAQIMGLMNLPGEKNGGPE